MNERDLWSLNETSDKMWYDEQRKPVQPENAHRGVSQFRAIVLTLFPAGTLHKPQAPELLRRVAGTREPHSAATPTSL